MSVDNGIAIAPAPQVRPAIDAPRPRIAFGDILWRRRSVRGQLLITILLVRPSGLLGRKVRSA